jgi:hypothetical protein
VIAPDELEARVRTICLALPGVTERRSHGAPAFFAGKQFVMLWPRGHHDHDFPHMWCAAAEGVQDSFVDMAPGRFFRPPYVGSRGWLGVRLDGEVDWAEVEMLCEDAWRVVAPRTMLARYDSGGDTGVGPRNDVPSLGRLGSSGESAGPKL